MSSHIKIVLCVGLFLYPATHAAAQDSIQISNGLKEPIRLWFLSRGQPDWSPPVFLPRSGGVKVYLAHQTDYWLVAKDLAGDEDYLGWIDLPKLAKVVPPIELVVGGGYVTTVKEMTRIVTVYETRQEKRKALICERVRVVGPDGRIRHVWMEREVEITHTFLVPVEKAEKITIRVRSLRVELSVNHNGKNTPIGEFLNRDKIKIIEKKMP